MDVVEIRWGVWSPLSITLQFPGVNLELAQILESFDGSATIREISTSLSVSDEVLVDIVASLLSRGVVQDGSHGLASFFQKNIFLSGVKLNNNSTTTCPRITIITAIENCFESMESGLNELGVHVDQVNSNELFDKIDLVEWQSDPLTFSKCVLQLKDSINNEFVWIHSARFDPGELLFLNSALHDLSITYLYSFIDGPFLFVGPTVVSGGSGCFECLEKRVLANLRSWESYLKYKRLASDIRRTKMQESNNPIILQNLICSVAQIEIVNYLNAGRNFTRNKVFSIYLPTLEMVFHELVPVSTCTTCGSNKFRDETEFAFTYADYMKKNM